MKISTTDALQILGLDFRATAQEIKSAYRRLASQWHPDRNLDPNASRQMQRINQAYQTLDGYVGPRTPETHAGGYNPFSSAQGTSHGGFNGYSHPGRTSSYVFDDESLDDDEFVKRGRHITRSLKINIFEAAFGFTRVLKGKVTDNCSPCFGTGTLGGSARPCRTCQGRGVVFSRGYTICKDCEGDGYVAPRCPNCGGTGKGAQREWEVTINAKGGIKNGDVILGASLGGKSGDDEGNRGDLRVRLQIEDHPLFELVDDQLRVEVTVSLWKWLLGGPVTIPTLEGTTQIDIRPLCESELVLPDLGWPQQAYNGVNAKRGPLFVEIFVAEPQDLTNDQKVLIEALAKGSAIQAVTSYEAKVKEHAAMTPQQRSSGNKRQTRKKSS